MSKDIALDSDQEQSLFEDFNINFANDSSQDFGLGYWMKRTTKCLSPQLPCHKSDKSVFNNKSTNYKAKESSLSLSYHKPKRSIKPIVVSNQKEGAQSKSNKLKYIDGNIPKLKISKEVIKNYIKTLSPHNLSQSSSSESEFSLYLSQNEKSTKRSKLKLRRQYNILESKSCTSSVISNSSCLEKSFEKLNNSITTSKYPLSIVNNDVMRLTLIIDSNIYHKFSNDANTSGVSLSNDKQKTTSNKMVPCNVIGPLHQVINDQSISSSISTEFKCNSLSFSCDISSEEKKSELEYYKEENQQRLLQFESSSNAVINVPIINNRKRSCSPLTEKETVTISAKKKLVEPYIDPAVVKEGEDKCIQNMTPVDFVRLVMDCQKSYERSIMKKYCLSQPNAMKFIAKNHADNWESSKNDISQMHLVPCEFLNEIFHRALHCFGLEKKILKETSNDFSSPINGCHSSHFAEYKKIRDEYSFSLKRVRYGIGVIDELFCRKVNYQNIPQNNDVPIVRKWKHIIYYFCLHAKSTFMAKEVQYYNYVQLSSNSFDGSMYQCANNTPFASCSSRIVDSYNKSQFPKGSSNIFDCKLSQKITPEHFSQSDLEISPHSYDSGKGSSIRTSSNANSLVSGCHTTSSLNSTPHSLQESQPNLCGFQMYRIDEYQVTAQEYIRHWPEVSQLHNKIISKVGVEPNANSHNNMIKLIHYVDICLRMSKDDLLNECLQRLLSQAVRL